MIDPNTWPGFTDEHERNVRFKIVYDAHFKAVCRGIAEYTKDPSPEDFVQEAFLKLLKASYEIDGVRQWLFVTALNAARDRYRLKYETTKVSVEVLLEVLEIPGRAQDPQRRSEIEELLRTFDKFDREIFILRSEGRSYSEIAKIQQCSETLIKDRMRLLRAKAEPILLRQRRHI